MHSKTFPSSQSGLTLAACLVTGMTSIACADVVSVNFRENNGNLNQQLAPMTEAGGGAGVGVSNWNDGLGATGEITDAVDETGTPTTLDLTWACGGTWGDGTANADADAGVGNAQLQRGYLDDNQGAPLLPIDITVSEIPYSTYDLVIYFSTDTTGDNYGEFTVTDANGTVTAATTGTKELWGTNPNLDETNSVLVSGLSGDLTLNFPVRSGPTRHSVSGLQVIENGGPALPLDLKITPSSVDTSRYTFTWNSKEGVLYDLVSSDDLSTSPSTWQIWEGQENLDGTGGEMTISDLPVDGSKRFFAVVEKTSNN
ncbi:MAG: hypothetical protein P1U90_07395 [Akkermansiaceae bacterium]|nr:hypothetical protein [Akkermansiaceae bacterium]